MTLSAEERFHLEVIKLLLQVAWGDDRVHPRERLAILTLGRTWKVREEELKALEERLMAGKGLPPPDLGLLRSQPERVLACARALATADGWVDEREQALITLLASMLGLQLG